MSNRVFAVLLLFSSSALAQAPPVDRAELRALQAAVAASQSAGDNAWMLVSAALVLMMTGPGLALFYCGLVRRKNVLGTMMQSFAMMAVITLLWAVCGYSLVFAPGNPFIGDLRYLFLRGVGAEPNALSRPQMGPIGSGRRMAGWTSRCLAATRCRPMCCGTSATTAHSIHACRR